MGKLLANLCLLAATFLVASLRPRDTKLEQPCRLPRIAPCTYDPR